MRRYCKQCEECKRTKVQSELQCAVERETFKGKSVRGEKLETGDAVLVSINNKSMKEWSGPHRVVEAVSVNRYCIQIDGQVRAYNSSLLRKYTYASAS